MTSEPRGLGESLRRLQERGPRVATDEDQEREAQALVDTWAKRIPPRFRDATLVGVDEQVRTIIEEWASTAPGPRTNLVLLGPVGAGKTHAAIAGLRICHEHGLSVMFTPVVEALDLLRPGGPPDVAARLSSAGVLLLDDLGSERTSDWTAERLYAVVNRRWLNELPTIVTSNVPGGELEHALDPLLFSRLVHNAIAVRIGGKDRRRS